MEDVLRESVEPVLRDLARSGLRAPRFGDGWTDDPDRPSAMMWGADGSGQGMSVQRSASLLERVVSAADQVQEWAIESELWGSAPTNWPPCPHHPVNHPLEARAVDGIATWVCPADRTPVAPIGG